MLNYFNRRKYDGSYDQTVAEIDKRKLGGLSDQALQDKSAFIRKQALNGTPAEQLLVDSFALVREASRRVLGMAHFSVQMIAGVALHRGKVVEMQTGEGKTLAAVMPAFLNALAGKGVHILTFNDYLARRDAEWMGPVYNFLGLKTAYAGEGMDLSIKQEAYKADITYVTAREAGFDYLRDFLCFEESFLIHRPFHYAIVDEADSVMLDEARIPLVIAGKMTEKESGYKDLALLAQSLQPGIDYEVDRYGANVSLTETGLMRVEDELGCGNLYEKNNLILLAGLNSALHAQALLERDKDYLVRNGRIEIIDEFTGRIADRRHWPDNLQAAVEAKEGLDPGGRGMILDSIALQHFLRLYPKLAGMTGTAGSAAGEFEDIYGLEVVVVPTNKPCIRKDHPDKIYSGREEKHQAVLEEIKIRHRNGQPILIGTGSVAESEELAGVLRQSGISCRVLNAKNDALEARIIAGAGEPGTVTVSTNMAGRGVDIKLGGEKEERRARVAAAGGLYVLGMCRHESRRVDEQLRGRAGRQGDPGESRFFLSLEDDFIVKYDLARLVPARESQTHRALQNGQRMVEGYLSDLRLQLGKYTFLIEQQRKLVHARRLNILTGAEVPKLLQTKAADRWKRLHSEVGEKILRQAEKRLALYYLNHCWAEYLEHMSYVRESIHLVVLGGQNPLDEFHRIAIEAFAQMEERIETEIIKAFQRADINKDGIDLERSGVTLPSATWTYLINDNPDQFMNLQAILKRSALIFLKPVEHLRSLWRTLDF